MDDATYARMEAKRERAAYYRGLEEAAHRAARRRLKAPRPKVRPRATQPKPEPRKWGLLWSRPIGPRPKAPSRTYKRKPREEWEPRSGRPQTRPDNCLGCERPFRPRQAKLADHPGTVYHAGHGLCRTCEQHPTKTTSGVMH